MFVRTITPRVSETNLTGHVGHSAVPVWLEEGYAEILRLFSENPAEPALIMVNINIDYLREIFFGRDVRIETGVKKVGRTSLVLGQELFQEGALCVRSETTFVHFDYKRRRPLPIPPAIRPILEGHLTPREET
ncbi:MAG TPA: thioesterase family protein [Syntrophales bacterium]|nr:thioesterase family protein [Syntrophales bacterium]HOM06072.1 thioesterase family protein [Syntrophales bacterium]HON99064.1 thioesterase family protein [Syntrophales bacterium]HPC00472.1 thioesterase family protein [Syntrophales bacterium]HPQ05555.1 thioesterase family protein [Syntrophales bacterium]